jgi:hypothetical protein
LNLGLGLEWGLALGRWELGQQLGQMLGQVQVLALDMAMVPGWVQASLVLDLGMGPVEVLDLGLSLAWGRSWAWPWDAANWARCWATCGARCKSWCWTWRWSRGGSSRLSLVWSQVLGHMWGRAKVLVLDLAMATIQVLDLRWAWHGTKRWTWCWGQSWAWHWGRNWTWSGTWP